jgi:hypothetical protein
MAVLAEARPNSGTYLTNFDPGLCVQPAPLCARVKPLLTRDPAQMPEGFTLDERPRNP